MYYVKNGELKCKFLELVHIKSAKAVDITGAFKGVLKKAGLLHKLICFGSDGANVMLGTGDGGGVAKRLREDNDVWSCLISLHCICHRLALAANEAADDVDHFQYIDKHSQSSQLHVCVCVPFSVCVCVASLQYPATCKSSCE